MKRIRCNFALLIPLFIIWLIMVAPVLAVTIPPGTPDPEFSVDIYKPDKVWPGTTLFADYHKQGMARIVEVNMKGEIVWEYVLPNELTRYTNPGFDVELLPNNNILFLLPSKGAYEVNRKGNIVWSYFDNKVSHDADRLPNGNTLLNFGAEDQKGDAQVKEVNPEGKVVWSWRAKDIFDNPPYDTVYFQGWTHANAVIRLPNGDTVVNLRNFNLTVAINPQGKVAWQYDWGSIGTSPHEPEVLPNGNILVCLHPEPGQVVPTPDQVVEVNPKTKEIIWQYMTRKPRFILGETRDTDRLPNGNTLINDGVNILEVTPAKEIVWRFNIKSLSELPLTNENHGLCLYKSERIGLQAPQFSIQYPMDNGCTGREINISIQYDNTDLGSIWYRIFDRTKNTWVTDNITYVKNKWANALTFEGKENGQQKITLGDGDYTLHVWASSTGWGDENLLVPKVINTAEKSVNFSVTVGCLATKPPATQGGSAALSPSIAIIGLIIAGLLAGLYKKRVR